MLTNDNEESRRMVESCYKRHKTTLNPIIEWEDKDVWEYLKTNGIPYCSLYDEGFHRLGCIGCPMASQMGRELEFLRWPKYKNAYLMAFDKMLKARMNREDRLPWKQKGQNVEATAMDVYRWWMEYDVLPGQFNLFEDYEDEDE